MKRANEVVSVPEEECIALTIDFIPFFEPPVQTEVKVDVGQHGGDDSTLRRSRFLMDDLPIRVQDACLQPLADQVQKGGIVDPLPDHPQQPVVIDIIEEAFDIGLDNVPEFSELEVELQVLNRLSGASVGPVSPSPTQVAHTGEIPITSRIFWASAWVENGLLMKFRPSSRTPLWAIISAVYPDMKRHLVSGRRV